MSYLRSKAIFQRGGAWAALWFLVPALCWGDHAIAPRRPNAVAYQISVELDPRLKRIFGQESITVTNHTGESLSRLYFHVYPNAFRWDQRSTYMRELRAFEDPDTRFLKEKEDSWLSVQDVSSAQKPISFFIQDELMTVVLPSALPAEATIRLEISFITQIGAIAERSGTWEGNFAVAQWFPKLMVYDQDGWALKHNRGYHYLGEFYGDFGSYDVEITAPSSLKVGATGQLRSRQELPGGRTSHRFWADKVHDFAWVADEAYEEQIENVDGVRLHVLTRNPANRMFKEYAVAAMRYFAKRIGPFPYPDFTVAETYYNGTMEYPQIVFIRSWPASLARWTEREFIRIYEMGVVHETSHQWFFAAVGNNEITDAWLDEGFASYLEQAFFRDTQGKDENMIKFTPLLEATNAQIGDMIWRSQSPSLKQPTQTPSYEFHEPLHYVAATYYKVALFFRHFEWLVGTKKLDEILRDYYRRNAFRNARPEDWYEVVRKHAGAKAERWWRDWITKNLESDYAISGIKTSEGPDKKFHSRFVVSQLGEFYAPVEVAVTERSGEVHRIRAPIDPEHHAVALELTTESAPSDFEVDPDRVVADSDRFNNKPGFFPKFEFWPITTNTIEDNAVTMLAAPFVVKRPGIGIEPGIFLGAAHYLDYYAYSYFGYDLQHQNFTVNARIGSIEPDLPWGLGWTGDSRRDVIVNRSDLYLKKALGPGIAHDPQNTVLLGPEYFGGVRDRFGGLSLGTDFSHSNLANGHAFRYALGVHNSLIKSLNREVSVDRPSLRAESYVPLYYQTALHLKGMVGSAINGQVSRSTWFDLQDEDEGGMRFDNADVGRYRVRALRELTVELQMPVPYQHWSDRLGFLHGPTWVAYLFSDMTPSFYDQNLLLDAGLGTRFDIASGGNRLLGLKLDLTPYQNAHQPFGWGFPVILFSVIADINGRY